MDTDWLSIHYTGYIMDTNIALDDVETPKTKLKIFDSSYQRGEYFHFKLGNNNAIKAFDYALTNMCIGEKRRMFVPPSLGFGNTQVKDVPPNTALIFDVELLRINRKDANGEYPKKKVHDEL